ncbi:MAG TPA: DUF2231 domain-containing protein [Verrucomicrobiae bacterium]|jgi:uncharacterized membrane protein|nr:DUF2231 domain-containing protein [Verrucomicrobiae bacterium]
MNFLPVHPALVHLPIAFILLSVIADLVARLSKSESRRAAFRTVGFWSLIASLVGAALAIAAGYVDMDRASLGPETDQFVDLHMTLGWVLGGCLVVLAAWRWLIWHRGQMTINTSYLVAAFLVLGITLFQGWYGSEMVYSYGAGVAPTGQGTETAKAAREPLIAVRDILQPRAAVGGAESPGGTNSTGTVKGH